MCDIPSTILHKLSQADAVVADLTFIAKTEGEKVKYCSNPNVLFELGYAFHSIGPERLILVANETHGKVANQIFDLNHRRHPIAFESPTAASSRKQTIEKLATKLADAIKSVMPLGLHGEQGGDDAILFERQLAEIRSFAEQEFHSKRNDARFETTFRPRRFRSKRWPDVDTDAGTLEEILRRSACRTIQRDVYPPYLTGTVPMDWGIFNNTYGMPWASTYSGQFWMSSPLFSLPYTSQRCLCTGRVNPS